MFDCGHIQSAESTWTSLDITQRSCIWERKCPSQSAQTFAPRNTSCLLHALHRDHSLPRPNKLSPQVRMRLCCMLKRATPDNVWTGVRMWKQLTRDSMLPHAVIAIINKLNQELDLKWFGSLPELWHYTIKGSAGTYFLHLLEFFPLLHYASPCSGVSNSKVTLPNSMLQGVCAGIFHSWEKLPRISTR